MHVRKEVKDWSERNFSRAALRDKRRIERVESIASSFASRPGASIPRACGGPYDVKATYNLFRHPEATPENLQAGHRSLVRRLLGEPGVSLLLEDTTEIAWETGRHIEGLGPVGRGRKWDQGFLLHSVLAVRWSSDPTAVKRPPLEVLGLADQQYYTRKPIPEGEGGDNSKQRQHRERESRLWLESGKHLGSAPEGSTWVRVCDRGADIYEFLRACLERGHGFVVRASQDRALAAGGRLFATVRAAKPMGCFALERRARRSHPARTAQLLTTAMPVVLKSPQRPGASQGRLLEVPCYAVRVWEPDPPAGEEALEWVLLVDRPLNAFEEVLEAVLQYASRWVVEDFHKALKTGLGAERLQLEDAHRLFAAISIMSVVALRLIDLRERLRVHPDAPAMEAGLDDFELKVLALYLKRRLSTVRDVALAIGRLGGHMNRKADGLPGLITLWLGMIELQALVAGARLGLQFRDLGND